MNYFAEALNSALDDITSNQTRLSKESGLDALQISQYCDGLALPEMGPLNQILELGRFERGHRLKLIAAYFQDLIPAEVAQTITVTSTDHVEIRIAHELASSLPEELLSTIALSKSENLSGTRDIR